MEQEDGKRIGRGLREIWATCGEVDGVRTLRVYQAYNEAIAAAVASANSFTEPRNKGIWSTSRMTWIKPSATWMAYRCGWSTLKDKNQAAVLALDLDMGAFLALLSEAVVIHGDMQMEKGECREKKVIVQWDPERELDPDNIPPPGHKAAGSPYLRQIQGVRSLQVGLRGRGSEMLCDASFVRRITDSTEQFRAAHEALRNGDLASARLALWPEPELEERLIEVPAMLQQVIGMHESECNSGKQPCA